MNQNFGGLKGRFFPITPLARSAAAFLGMLGQIYLVVLLGILIGIYLNQHKVKDS